MNLASRLTAHLVLLRDQRERLRLGLGLTTELEALIDESIDLLDEASDDVGAMHVLMYGDAPSNTEAA